MVNHFRQSTHSLPLSSECNSEQAAAKELGFSQLSWDNKSGKEKQPASFDKYFKTLTHKERLAAVVLGYTGTNWDNDSGSELQPISRDMSWSKLEACGEHF